MSDSEKTRQSISSLTEGGEDKTFEIKFTHEALLLFANVFLTNGVITHPQFLEVQAAANTDLNSGISTLQKILEDK